VEVLNVFTAQSDPATAAQLKVTLPIIAANSRIRSSFEARPDAPADSFAFRPIPTTNKPPSAPFVAAVSKQLHSRLFNALLETPSLAFSSERSSLLKRIVTSSVKGETPVGTEEARFLLDEAAKASVAKHSGWCWMYQEQS
jgi:hypothetical protein